jgi:hypothetical protein
MSPAGIPLVSDLLDGGQTRLARSGIQWLVPDGSPCAAGELIAYARVGFTNGGGGGEWPPDELRDFQVAFAPRVSGRVTWRREVGATGWDGRFLCKPFDPNEPIGDIVPSTPSEDGRLRLLWLAGRRAVEFGEGHGLMAGWHDRLRGWWCDTKARPRSILAMGICSLSSVVGGARGVFADLFAECPGPAHVVQVNGDLLIPSAAVLLANLDRTAAEAGEIGADFARWMESAAPDGLHLRGRWSLAQDTFFVTHLLGQLAGPSPLLDEYSLVGSEGMYTLGPATTVVLSLDSESAYHLRHKRLGYPIALHGFRFADISPSLKRWLKGSFEPIERTPEDVERDLVALVDRARSLAGVRLVFVNSVETSSSHIPRSAPTPLPPRARNLALAGVARKRSISVIDADAMAVDLGIHRHIPDGMHPSGDFERALRGELLRTLRALGLTGY